MQRESDMMQGGGNGFAMGLLCGMAVGAAVGMMFAPKSGPELRRQLSDAGARARNTANERYRRASSSVTHIVEKGRDAVAKGREAFQRTRESSTQPGMSTSSSTESTTPSSPMTTPSTPSY